MEPVVRLETGNGRNGENGKREKRGTGRTGNGRTVLPFPVPRFLFPVSRFKRDWNGTRFLGPDWKREKTGNGGNGKTGNGTFGNAKVPVPVPKVPVPFLRFPFWRWDF